jgi:hypothetical protein
MITVITFILAAMLFTVLRNYFGRWEVVNENGDRVVCGSYSRCYSHWSAHPYRMVSWEIRKINQ